jgi:hypothetical protein
MFRAGVAKALVRILRQGSRRQQADAASLISCIATSTSRQTALTRAGAAPALVSLLRSTPSPAEASSEESEGWTELGGAPRDAKVEAARAALRLAISDANRDVLAAAGALEPLLSLLRDGETEDGRMLAAHAVAEEVRVGGDAHRGGVARGEEKGDRGSIW